MSTEVGTGFEPAYTALQAAASPLGHPTVLASGTDASDSVLRADDETRTRDIHLGKVVLYQLSYVRMSAALRLRPTSLSALWAFRSVFRGFRPRFNE